MNNTAAGASPVDCQVRPLVAEARWYCVSADGMAMLCKDEEDARANARLCDLAWPNGAPHRAVLLGDVAAERERCEKLRRLLQGAEVLFAPLCRDATAWNWLDEARTALAEPEGPNVM